MVVEVGLTEMEVPVPTKVPPHEPVYHFQEAPVPKEPPTLFKVTEPPQEGLGLAVALVGAIDTGVYVKDTTAL